MILATSDTSSFTLGDLFAGEKEIVTATRPVAAATALARHEVVALNSSGELVAFDAAGAAPVNKAVGITCEAVDSNTQLASAAIYVSGYFNTSALTWTNAATDAQKAAAFAGTEIQIRDLG